MSLKKIITLDNLQSFYNKLPSWIKNSTKPSYSYSEIDNTPSLGTAASRDVAPGGGNADNTQVVMGNDSRLTNSRNPTAHASDLVTSLTGYSTAKAATSAIPISDSDSLNTAMGKLEKDTELNQTNILSVEDMVCDTEFSTSTAYSVGDIVTHEHSLYKFTSAHSAGAWNSSEVDQIDMTDLVNSGSGGSVDSITIGGSGTTAYTPDANGNIDLPAYPTPNTYTGSGAISVNSSTNVISHSTSAGYKHIPSGGSTGQFLKYSSSGTASWQPLPYGSESAQGAVRVWVTTVGSDTVLHISNQATT